MSEAFGGCTNLAAVFFEGNAPTAFSPSAFRNDENVIAYCVPYTSGWETAFVGVLPTLPWNGLPKPATATAFVDFGFVVSAAVEDPGNGYSNAPAVSFIGGGGSGAQAKSTITGGVVTAITILDAGSGYTTPTIVIDPPPVSALLPMATDLVRVACGSLAANVTYQIQESPDLRSRTNCGAMFSVAAWTNNGAAFTAMPPTNSQYINSEAASGFFRAQCAP